MVKTKQGTVPEPAAEMSCSASTGEELCRSTPSLSPGMDSPALPLEPVPAGEKTKRSLGLPRFLMRGRDDQDAAACQSAETRDEHVLDEKPTKGWVSPAYTVSRSVSLDPAVLNANRCILHRRSDSVEVDAYRVLRTKILQKCKEQGGNTIMITSAVPGEGKTLNAVNLAVTLAREFMQTVLLVDCDLRRQSVHKYLGYASDKGIIDYLLNDTPVSELMTWPGIEKLTVISGGRPISGSSELLGSQRMQELVDAMKSRYPERYIIFDVPPLLAGADALAFVPVVDHVVVVVREGETSAKTINKALKLVPPDKVLGLVLNGQESLSHLVQYSIRQDHAH
jgi:protein-tyrosine kinase